MTHDELLAKIDAKGSADFATLKYNPEGQKDIQDVFKALRAVVELHKPQKLYGLSPIYSDELFCKQCDVLHPCPTIQAIEKELR